MRRYLDRANGTVKHRHLRRNAYSHALNNPRPIETLADQDKARFRLTLGPAIGEDKRAEYLLYSLHDDRTILVGEPDQPLNAIEVIAVGLTELRERCDELIVAKRTFLAQRYRSYIFEMAMPFGWA